MQITNFESLTYPTSKLPRINGPSPWGRIDNVSKLADGIFQVSTAGHGGIYLTDERVGMMPECSRISPHWYEEDCEALLPLFHFWNDVRDSFPDLEVERVMASLCYWHPNTAKALDLR